ncbi:hypothetical protein LTR10_018935 [Elasticomyces elasticus]|uniref:Uncharacterized protein n=1 Tax=Exophiala sideris TaxID=1016849 RepID=A0ABR0IXZ4_9EURO|nr:hypothetical protein LTR10_018935 [Elasticomyces elasticus]KAK5022311.1 hypothetical protein LTS07_010187 [Exophiala sideris]KAK5027123.1 hypothetical protein LTR13_009733 [Exophiala sideris]KAK5051698.1 hypothetical protein LTR69_010198 [Exophiala sideris]KAK5177663.1 hypothetical protein LTR44_009853 [Eurotiomycetes sp. CCFEE 6388]
MLVIIRHRHQPIYFGSDECAYKNGPERGDVQLSSNASLTIPSGLSGNHIKDRQEYSGNGPKCLILLTSPYLKPATQVTVKTTPIQVCLITKTAAPTTAVTVAMTHLNTEAMTREISLDTTAAAMMTATADTQATHTDADVQGTSTADTQTIPMDVGVHRTRAVATTAGTAGILTTHTAVAVLQTRAAGTAGKDTAGTSTATQNNSTRNQSDSHDQHSSSHDQHSGHQGQDDPNDPDSHKHGKALLNLLKHVSQHADNTGDDDDDDKKDSKDDDETKDTTDTTTDTHTTAKTSIQKVKTALDTTSTDDDKQPEPIDHQELQDDVHWAKQSHQCDNILGFFSTLQTTTITVNFSEDVQTAIHTVNQSSGSGGKDDGGEGGDDQGYGDDDGQGYGDDGGEGGDDQGYGDDDQGYGDDGGDDGGDGGDDGQHSHHGHGGY